MKRGECRKGNAGKNRKDPGGEYSSTPKGIETRKSTVYLWADDIPMSLVIIYSQMGVYHQGLAPDGSESARKKSNFVRKVIAVVLIPSMCPRSALSSPDYVEAGGDRG